MARMTSLDKFMAATAETGLLVSVDPSWRRGWYGHDAGEVVVSVMSMALVEEIIAKYLSSPTNRVRNERVGYEVFFTGDGKYLGTNRLDLDGYLYHRHAEEEDAQLRLTEWRIIKDTGSRRAEYFMRSFTDTLESVSAISPVTLAKVAAEAAERKARREAEEAARYERIKAVKPDVRQAVWNINHELERAQSGYVGNLKAIISRAEELLRRAEETPGYVYESDLTHLARLAADAAYDGAKVMAYSTATRGDLAPLFEGSPWSDD